MIASSGIIITIAFTIVSAYIDDEHVEDGDYIENHRSRWILRFLFCLVFGFYNPIWIVASGLLFWVFFDQMYNYFMEKPFWYLGTTAYLDRFFKKRMVLYISLKLLSLIIGIILFCI